MRLTDLISNSAFVQGLLLVVEVRSSVDEDLSLLVGHLNPILYDLLNFHPVFLHLLNVRVLRFNRLNEPHRQLKLVFNLAPLDVDVFLVHEEQACQQNGTFSARTRCWTRTWTDTSCHSPATWTKHRQQSGEAC